MSDLKPRGVSVAFEGIGERHLLFDLNAIEALQDKYDKGIWEVLNEIVNDGSKAGPGRNIPLVRFTLFTLLEAERERAKELRGEEIPAVSERAVGGIVGMDNYGDVLKVILKAYGISMPEPDGEENPNAKSG